MALGDEVVLAAGTNGEPDEEEEEELVDPQTGLRENCEAKSECQKYQDELTACNERVSSKESTTETCAQELYDFIHCVDHCISKSLFTKLK